MCQQGHKSPTLGSCLTRSFVDSVRYLISRACSTVYRVLQLSGVLGQVYAPQSLLPVCRTVCHKSLTNQMHHQRGVNITRRIPFKLAWYRRAREQRERESATVGQRRRRLPT